MSSDRLARARAWLALADPPFAVAAVVLGLLVLAAYAGSLVNDFVFDDRIFVEKDVRVQSIVETPRLFTEPLWHIGEHPVRPGSHAYYRPLQLLPLSLSHFFFGTAAWPCHALSLFVHWLNALLAYALFRALIGAAEPALAAAGLFAVHPAYSEAIFWISDIAGLGVALATLAIVRLHGVRRGASVAGRLAIGALFLAALWCKETGVVIPFVMLLHDAVIGAHGRRALASYVALVPALFAYVVGRRAAMGGLSLGLQSIPFTPVELVANSIALVPGYVATFLWPFDLNFYHVFVAVPGLASARVVLGSAVLVIAAFGFFGTLRRHPPVAFGIGWALLTVAPTLLPRWTELNVYAERYLYLPSIGLFLAIGYGLARLGDRAGETQRRRLFAAVAALVLVFMVAAELRALDWRDDVTLYSSALEQSPDAKLVLNNLGVAFYERGRYDDGIRLLEKLMTLDAEFPQARQNLALLYNAVGRLEEAATKYREAAKAEPRNPTLFLNLGYVYDRLGRREDAVASYVRTTRLDPGQSMAWHNLAVIALETGQVANAESAIRRALTIEPGDRAARRLLRGLAGQAPRARVPAAPDSPETIRRCKEAKRMLDGGRREDAIDRLEAAAWLDETSPLPHQYLANVFTMSGKLERALRQQQLALERDPGNPIYERNLRSLREALSRRGPLPSPTP